MPAKLSWHSEIWPPKPTSGTSDSATIPIGNRRPNVSWSGVESVVIITTPPNTTTPAKISAPRIARHREVLAAARHAAAQARVGQDQQDEEQQDRRARDPQAGQVRVLRQVPGEVALGEADHDRADERERQAAQPPEDRGRVRADDEQAQRRRVERDVRGDEDAAERGERGAERPGEHRHAVGAGAVQRRERRVVDGGAHRDAEPEPGEHDAQPDRDERWRRRW